MHSAQRQLLSPKVLAAMLSRRAGVDVVALAVSARGQGASLHRVRDELVSRGAPQDLADAEVLLLLDAGRAQALEERAEAAAVEKKARRAAKVATARVAARDTARREGHALHASEVTTGHDNEPAHEGSGFWEFLRERGPGQQVSGGLPGLGHR